MKARICAPKPKIVGCEPTRVIGVNCAAYTVGGNPADIESTTVVYPAPAVPADIIAPLEVGSGSFDYALEDTSNLVVTGTVQGGLSFQSGWLRVNNFVSIGDYTYTARFDGFIHNYNQTVPGVVEQPTGVSTYQLRRIDQPGGAATTVDEIIINIDGSYPEGAEITVSLSASGSIPIGVSSYTFDIVRVVTLGNWLLSGTQSIAQYLPA